MKISDKTQAFFNQRLDSNQNGVSYKELQALDQDNDGKIDTEFQDQIDASDRGEIEAALAKTKRFEFANADEIIFPLREVSSTATVPDFAAEREALGQEMAQMLNTEEEMSLAEYNQDMNLGDHKRPSQGYFAQNQQKLATQAQKIDALLLQAKAQEPVDQTEVYRLENLKELNWNLQNLHAGLKVANHRRDPLSDAASLVKQLTDVQTALGELGPRGLGAEAYQGLKSSIEDYTQIALTFPQIAGRGNASNALDLFTLQTYRRVQQIESGQRVRANETPDVTGSLTSFFNDIKDMQTFLKRFRVLESQLAAGKFGSQSEYRAAMLAAVPKTSNAFQQSVSNLANAKWNVNQGQIAMRTAQSKYQQAQSSVQSAFAELQAAQEDLQDSSAQLGLSEGALKQSNLSGAREALHKAQSLSTQADQHLKTYERLRSQGSGQAQEAERYRRLAVSSLNTANSYNELVKAGPYARDLKPETDRVSAQTQQLQAMARSLHENLGILQDNLGKMTDFHKDLKNWHTGLAQDIQRLDAGIDLTELQAKVQDYAKGGIDNARARMAQLMEGYDLSEETKLYLSAPSKVDDDDKADVREELAELFEEKPLLARTVARELSSMRSELAEQRSQLVDKFGEASPQVRALDLTQQQVVEAWLNRDGVLLEALIEAGGESPDVQKGIQDTLDWMRETQVRFGNHMLNDSQHSTAAAQGFDQWLQSQEELKGRLDEVKGDYGEPTAQVPMTLMMDKTGRMVTFNAYVFQDGDTVKVLNPLDQRVYEGSTRDEALADLASGTSLADGTLRYRDSKGIQTASISAPTDSFWADVGMGAVGIVGGILLAVPEPTTATKWGGGAMVGSSATYFTAKGALKMVDLVQHETFGNNAETWGAALDIASGLLVFARGAGALAQTAKTTESALVKSLAQMGKSANLTRAEYATFAAGASFAGHQLYYGVIENDNLSDKEKLATGAKIVGAMSMPLMMAPAMRLGSKLLGKSPETIPLQDVKTAHRTYMKNLTSLEEMMTSLKKGGTPESLAVLQQQLSEILPRAREVYETPAMQRQTEWQADGLSKIVALEAELAKLPTPTPVSRTLAPAEQAKIRDIEGDLIGDAVALREFPSKGAEPPKRLIDSEVQLEAGKTKEEARALVQDRMTEIIKQMEADGLTVKPHKPGATQIELLDSSGKPAKRVSFQKKDYGQIKIQDLQKNYIEQISFNSPEVAPVTTRTTTPPAQTKWMHPENQKAGIPSPAELSAMKGTAPADMIENFGNIKGQSIQEIMSRVPADAQLRELKPLADGASQGFEFSWRTLNAEGNPTSMKVRIHGPDVGAPKGSNAAEGWVAIVERGGHRLDGTGQFQPGSILKATFRDGSPNPDFNPTAANETHIPIKGNPVLQQVSPVVPKTETEDAIPEGIPNPGQEH